MDMENNQFTSEENITTETPVQEPAPETPAEASEPAPYTECDAPKKKKFNLKKFLLIILPALAVIIAIIIGIPAISSCYMKNFASPKDYLTYIEMKNITNEVKDFAKAYGNYKKAYTEPVSAKSEITVELGESALDMLAASMVTGDGMEYIDWSFLSEIGIDIETVSDGEKISYDMLLSLSGEDVLLYNLIYDYAEGFMYYGMPELSEDYLRTEMITPQQEGMVYYDFDEISELAKEYLPTSHEIEDILIRYARIVYENMNNVTREDTTVEANGVSQQVMKFTVNFDKQTCNNIQIKVFEALAKDKDVENITDRIQKAAEKQGATFDTDLYDQFADYLMENVAELKEKDVEKNYTIFKLYIYADNSEKVIGRAISSTEGGREESVGYCQTTNGNKFGYELFTPENAFAIKGDGIKEGDSYSGKYELIIEDEKVATVKADTEGSNSGKYKLTPEKGLYKMFGMDDSEAAAMKLMGLSLEFEYERSDDTWGELELGLNMMGQNFISVVLKSSESEKTEVVIPENYVDAEYAQEWAENLDMEKLYDNLKDAGLPDFFSMMLNPQSSM